MQKELKILENCAVGSSGQTIRVYHHEPKTLDEQQADWPFFGKKDRVIFAWNMDLDHVSILWDVCETANKQIKLACKYYNVNFEEAEITNHKEVEAYKAENEKLGIVEY